MSKVILNLKLSLGILLQPIMFLVYFLSGFSPRSREHWIFGSWSGQRFTDNAAALFEYVQHLESSAIKTTWISSEPKIVAQLRELGYEAHLRWSLRGILACLDAGVFVFDGLTRDINHWLSRGSERVLLRHGVGFKKVARGHENPGHRLYQLFHGQWWQRMFWAYLLPWHLVRPDLMTATSPDHAEQGELFYGVDSNDIVITGFPRNDALFSSETAAIDPQIRSMAAEADDRGLPIFAYLPTFRDDSSHFEFPLRELEEMASRIGIILAIKLHFVDSLRAKSYEPNPNGNLRLLNPHIDPIQIFPVAAGLISDYSSVVFDYMLTERPVIFFVPDLDEYLQHSRSFCYDFDEVTPGPKARTLNELEGAIVAARDNNLEEWRKQYESVLTRFHTYRDAQSSQRVYDTIFAKCVANADSKENKGKIDEIGVSG